LSKVDLFFYQWTSHGYAFDMVLYKLESSKKLREFAMSNAELLVESDLEISQPDQNIKVPENIGLDDRSQEMLLVLNEVFDSIHPSNKS